ncbi:hypothetical protein Ahu01nite_033660 [Winogradskya humida]|uniref:Uncharacterized protein n=1 Tax=Winogradskya humida TaxID=113566 RepID=A0ABQ3ZP31_9ACTN|nr:hypothetical protein Ahu01nite_033660 [Actinoplanes humidus]
MIPEAGTGTASLAGTALGVGTTEAGRGSGVSSDISGLRGDRCEDDEISVRADVTAREQRRPVGLAGLGARVGLGQAHEQGRDVLVVEQSGGAGGGNDGRARCRGCDTSFVYYSRWIGQALNGKRTPHHPHHVAPGAATRFNMHIS